ncbi:MAG TPA: hypothetical protein PK315_02125 [Petrotogaceae bacterium]|nr:hypothetical protein [Petrotogaceae bacterium]HPO26248.1 hypothetical protein [Petrotogaceae bacterium]
MKKTVFIFLVLLIFSTVVFSGELLKITTISPNLDTAVAHIGVSFLTDYNVSAGIEFPLIRTELFDSFSILGLYGFSFTSARPVIGPYFEAQFLVGKFKMFLGTLMNPDIILLGNPVLIKTGVLAGALGGYVKLGIDFDSKFSKALVYMAIEY